MSEDRILAALNRLEAGQSLLSAGQADMSGRLERLEAGQQSMSGHLERLETGQQSLRADFFEELGKTRAAIMDKVETLQDAITAIHDDIAVNFGAVDQMRLVNNNTRDEMRGLTDTVARMMTLILRLQTEVAELKKKPSD
jgi:chromosome segregation ATPase